MDLLYTKQFVHQRNGSSASAEGVTCYFIDHYRILEETVANSDELQKQFVDTYARQLLCTDTRDQRYNVDIVPMRSH